jgi:hypothetical protein
MQYGRVRVSGDGTATHRAIHYPQNEPGYGDDLKVITSRKTFGSVAKKVVGKILGKGGAEFGGEYGTTQGREDQEGEERMAKVTAIHHEKVSGGWKLEFDTSVVPRTTFQPPRKSDEPANHATVADFSLGRLVEGATHEENVTVKVASLWALPADAYQVPKTDNLLKRMRKDKGKGRAVESMSMFTNFVHVVEVTFPRTFSGTVPNEEPHSPRVVDFTMPALRAGQ